MFGDGQRRQGVTWSRTHAVREKVALAAPPNQIAWKLATRKEKTDAITTDRKTYVNLRFARIGSEGKEKYYPATGRRSSKVVPSSIDQPQGSAI